MAQVKKDKVIVIGTSSEAHSVVERLQESHDAVIANDICIGLYRGIDINGTKYIKREQKSKGTSLMNSRIGIFIGMAMMMGGSSQTKRKSDSLVNIDIVEEFRLIQNKKSNLSANQRKVVVNRFHRLYKLLDDER